MNQPVLPQRENMAPMAGPTVNPMLKATPIMACGGEGEDGIIRSKIGIKIKNKLRRMYG